MSIAVLFHGKLREHEVKYKNEISHLVMKHFVNCYSAFCIDFYGHLWDEFNNDYSAYSNNIVVESNIKYQVMINDIYNHTDRSSENSWVKSRAKAQISNLISICKAIDIVDNSNKKYDYVVIFRPDYIVWETIRVPSNIDENTIYINKHGPNKESGESIFILHRSKLIYFKDMLSDIIDGNVIPKSHFFYYNYFVNLKKMKYEQLYYDVGSNCEQVTMLHMYYKTCIKLRNLINGFNHLLTLRR